MTIDDYWRSTPLINKPWFINPGFTLIHLPLRLSCQTTVVASNLWLPPISPRHARPQEQSTVCSLRHVWILPNAYDINVDALSCFSYSWCFCFIVILIFLLSLSMSLSMLLPFSLLFFWTSCFHYIVEAGCGLSERFLQEKQPQATSNSTFFQPLQVAAPAHFQREQPAPHALGHVARLKEENTPEKIHRHVLLCRYMSIIRLLP